MRIFTFRMRNSICGSLQWIHMDTIRMAMAIQFSTHAMFYIPTNFGDCFHFVLLSWKSNGSSAYLMILFMAMFCLITGCNIFRNLFHSQYCIAEKCAQKNCYKIKTYPNTPNAFAFRINCRWSQTTDFHPIWWFLQNSSLEIRLFPSISAILGVEKKRPHTHTHAVRNMHFVMQWTFQLPDCRQNLKTLTAAKGCRLVDWFS